VRIEMADSGPGITRGDLEKLWEPFFTTRQRGTGLGLAIVSHILSEHGARVTGLQEPLESGEIVILERANNRAKYKVAWMGKPGTPLAGQAGMQMLPKQESIWDVDIAQIQEEYEPIVVDENLIPTHREAMFSPGKARVKVAGSGGQGDGQLIQLSEHECTVLVDREFLRNSALTLFVRGEGFDVRFRGVARAYGSGHLVVDLCMARKYDEFFSEKTITVTEQ